MSFDFYDVVEQIRTIKSKIQAHKNGIGKKESSSFTPPQTWKLKFIKKSDDSKDSKYSPPVFCNTPTDELLLYYLNLNISLKYPIFIISLLVVFPIYRAEQNFKRGKKLRSYICAIISGVFGLVFWLMYYKTNIVKSITLKNGNTLCIKSFFKNQEYIMDVNDMITVTEKMEPLLFADANGAEWKKKNNFNLFLLPEVDSQLVYNSELFKTVIFGRNYLKYLDEYPKL